MKLLFGLLSNGFGKTLGLGESDNLPGLCPELPNQEKFQIERYLGQWHGWVYLKIEIMTRGILSYRKFNLWTGLLRTSKSSPDLWSPYSRPLKSRGCSCYRPGPLWLVNFFNKGVLRMEIRFLEIQDGKDVDVLRGPVHKPKKFSVISQMMINIFHQKSDVLVKIFAPQVKVLRTDISFQSTVQSYGPWIHETGLDDTVIVVNTSLNDKKNTFNFAEGTATQAFDLPNQPGISKIYEKIWLIVYDSWIMTRESILSCLFNLQKLARVIHMINTVMIGITVISINYHQNQK